MSFNLNLRAPTKAGILTHLSAQLDGVVSGQPIHAKDRDAVTSMVEAFLAKVDEAEGKDLVVAVSGGIGTTDDVVTFVHGGVTITFAEADTSTLDEGASADADSGGGGHGVPPAPGGPEE